MKHRICAASDVYNGGGGGGPAFQNFQSTVVNFTFIMNMQRKLIGTGNTKIMFHYIYSQLITIK